VAAVTRYRRIVRFEWPYGVVDAIGVSVALSPQHGIGVRSGRAATSRWQQWGRGSAPICHP
jgi:hypothetical protein